MKEQSQSLLDINSSGESSQLKSENNLKHIENKAWYEKITNAFQSVGDEIWFAFTFIGRIIMTIYSIHGLFFIYNFIVEFIILIPGRLYDLESVAVQWIFGIFYILFSMAASNVLVIPTYEFFKKEEEQSLNEFLNVKNIKENMLYTLDGQVVQFIKVEPINIELLTDEELE